MSKWFRSLNPKRLAATLCLVAAPEWLLGQASPSSQNPTGIDAVIALVQANIPESLVVKHIRSEAKAYNLTTADLIKLQKAKVPTNIIELMMDAKEQPAAAPANAPAPPPGPAPSGPAAVTNGEGDKKEAKRGFFGRVGSGLADRSKKVAGRSVDSAERTLDRNAAAAEKRANDKIDQTQDRTDRAVDRKLGAVDQKTTGALDGKSSTSSSGQTLPKKTVTP